jgi:WD40 repeat protein
MTQIETAQQQKSPTAELSKTSPNPYVGPRPFTSAEKDRFFGREQEANQIIPLIIAERMVLFYAQSGAGKSSLINTRLVPGLTARNFKVLTGRVSGQSAEGAEADNIFTYNLLLSFERSEHGANGGDQDLKRLAHINLADYLADMDIEAPAVKIDAVASSLPDSSVPGGNGADGAKAQHLLVDAPEVIGGVQPLALIIDQFEEIFTTNPGSWSQRAPFFQQVSDAMNADPYLWVVLSIREDYIASLDPYVDLLPGKLRARFYMQRMGYSAALEAVCRPVENLRPFDENATDELVKNLSLINTGKDKNNNPIYQPGQFIEPVQLQVVCYQLWEELRNRPGKKITRDDLLSLAKGKDLAEFISTALANYYVQSLHEVIKLQPAIRERHLRDWFSKELITETETRSAVRQGKDSTGTPPNDLPNEVVRTLQERFIIRAEIRGENTWFELSHDRFVGPIVQSNREWFDKNSQPVEAAAQAWFDAGQDVARLYDGRQLQVALNVLRDHPDDLSDKAKEFINASQATVEKRQKIRQRAIIVFFAVLLVVLSGLTAFSFQQSQLAKTQEAIAQSQKITAQVASTQSNEQRSTAVAASILEAEQRHRAETASAMEAGLRQSADLARSTAEAAKSQAEVAKDQAEVASTQAVQERDAARKAEIVAQAALTQAEGARLASLSDYFRNTKLDLSLLLAVQAVKTSPGWDGYRALLNGIQTGLANRVSRIGYPWYVKAKPYSVTFSPDGAEVAVSSIGHVDIWNTNGQGQTVKVPPGFETDFSIYSVAYDSTGNLMARAGGDGEVRIWDRTTGKVSTFRPFGYVYASVLSVAFQPGGDLLAVGTEKDPTSGKGLLFLYNYKMGKTEASWDCGVSSCPVLAWSPDGKRLAIGSQGGSLQIYDAEKKASAWTVDRAHAAEITGLAWYPDGQRLVTGGVDQRLILWDTTAHKALIQTDKTDNPIIISLSISPDGRFLLLGVNDDSTWFGLWDSESLKRLKYPISGHSQPISGVAFNPQGNLFVTAGYDNTVILWKFEPVDTLGKQVLTLTGKGRVDGLFQSKNGKLSFARTVGVTNLELVTEGAQKPDVQKIAHTSLEFATVNGSPAVALGGDDGQISFVDPSSGKPVRAPVKVASGSIRSLAVSTDGKLLATSACKSGVSCGEISLWDMSSNKPVALKSDLSTLKLGIVTSLAFSPDEKTLALGSGTGKIIFYDIETGKVDQAVTEGLGLQNATLVTTSLAFSSPDQNLMAAGFQDGRIALWNASSRGPIGEFVERMNGEVTGLLFRKNPEDGTTTLVSVSSQGEVREWAVDEKAWIARACQLAGRTLTPEEKAKFLLPGSSQADICPAKK